MTSDALAFLKFLAYGSDAAPDENEFQQMQVEKEANKGWNKAYDPFYNPPNHDIALDPNYRKPEIGPTYMPEEDINNPFYDRQDPEWRRNRLMQRLAQGLNQQQPAPNIPYPTRLFDSQGGTY